MLDDVVRALEELRRQRPGLRRAVVKLNDSFSGEGNGIFCYPAEEGREAIAAALARLEFPVANETPETFFEKLSRMGGSQKS